MSVKKCVIIAIGLAFLAVTVSAVEKYENPALNKVKFEETPKHKDIELVKNNGLDFVIVADLAAEEKAAIVETGKPVGGNRESLHQSVEILQKSFEHCTGKRPEAVSPDSPELAKYRYKILLGKSSLSDKLGIKMEAMPVEGFKVMTYPEGIAIVGKDGSLVPGSYHANEIGTYAINGTLNGVYDFVERFLGMRFYYPGLGVYAPPVKDLSISPVAYTDKPKYLTRSFGWGLTTKFLQKGQERNLGHRPIGRNLESYWPWDDITNDQKDFLGAYRAGRSSRFMGSEGPHPFLLGKAFPDKLDTIFYREKNGKLHYSPTVYNQNYFDVSNPEFAKLLADSYKKFYDTKGEWSPLWQEAFPPNPEYMWFGPVDTSAFIDNERTAKLKKLNAEEYNKLSEVNGHFYLMLANLIKESLPDKKIVFMAYSHYLGAPETVKKYPDNVRILACVGTPAYIRHKGYQDFFKSIYMSWNEKLSEKVIPYPYDPSYYTEGGISHAIRGVFEGEFLKTMQPYISDYALFACVHFRWEYYYSGYLIARAYWNPDFDHKAALDEHWKLLYGDAAPYLKEFHELLVTRWVNNYLPKLKVEKRCIPGIDYTLLYSEGYPREVGLKLQELLDNAKKAVKPGSVEERRLIFFMMPWYKLLGELFAYQNIKVPQYKILYAEPENKISVDGKLDENIWKKATRMTLNSSNYGQNTTNTVPEVKLVWNKSGLYLAFRSPAPYKKIGKLWDEDNFELFISPGITKNAVFQLVLSSSGQFEDYYQSFDPPRPFDINWSCKGIEKAVVATDAEWSCEIYIPFCSFEDAKAPVPGDCWFGNLVCNRTDSEATSLSPTLGNNINTYSYAKLYFAGNCE